MADGQTRNLHDTLPLIGSMLNLSEEDMSLTLEKSGMNQHNDRCSRAKTYLVKAGLLKSPARAQFIITDSGKKLLDSGFEEITVKYLRNNYPTFAEFSKGSNKDKKNSKKEKDEIKVTPLQKNGGEAN